MSSDEIIEIESIPLLLNKSLRAKRVFLKQNTKGEIILTYPKFYPKCLAIRFAKSQIPWIVAHLKHGQKETVFSKNDTIQILGNIYLLNSGKRTQATKTELIISGEPEFFHRRVCSYAQKKLLPYVQEKVTLYTTQLGVKHGKITLRNTSSRWGSCSSTRNLSFCWKIAFAPLDVIDYLVAHEVAHLLQMNHSPKFWATVDKLVAHRLQAEKWLRENGRKLQSIR